MGSLWDVKLIPVKVLLFLFYGSYGCLWPFLPVHMKQIGLSLEEVAIISMFLPFISAVACSLIAALADNHSAHRIIFMFCCFSTAIFYHSLLFIPSAVSTQLYPATAFFCNSTVTEIQTRSCVWDNVTEPCGTLTRNQHQLSSAKLDNCRYLCDDLTTITDSSMYLCLSTTKQLKEQVCRIINISDQFHQFDLQFTTSEGKSTSDQWGRVCSHSLTSVYSDRTEYSYVSCRTNREGCRIKCDVINDDNNSEMTCKVKINKTRLTFFLYLVLRSLAEISQSSCAVLLQAMTLAVCKEHGGQFGRQHMFGVISIGVFSFFSGYLLELFNRYQDQPSFDASFYVVDVLMIVCMILTFSLVFRSIDKPKHFLRDLGKVFLNLPILSLFFASFMLGCVWGFVKTYLYWYLSDLGAPKLLLGLTLTTGALVGVPVLFASGWIIKRVGFINVIILAFFAYMLRNTGYAIMDNPWWCLVFEALECLNLYLPRVAFATAIQAMSPATLIATSQAVALLLHYNIGRGVGSFTGGYSMNLIGSRPTFVAAAIFSGITGALYMCLHYIIIKPRMLNKRKSVGVQCRQNGFTEQDEELNTENPELMINGNNAGFSGRQVFR